MLIMMMKRVAQSNGAADSCVLLVSAQQWRSIALKYQLSRALASHAMGVSGIN